MKKKFVFLFCSILLLAACKSTSTHVSENKETVAAADDVPYTIANRYFINSDYPEGKKFIPAITTEEEFKAIFGMARVNTPDGKPTPIDFTKQYVVAIINESTNGLAEIKVNSLKKENDHIVMEYSIKNTNQSSQMTTRVPLIIILDKKYDGPVQGREIK